MEREVLENINPHVFEKLPPRLLSKSCDNDYEPVDPREVFGIYTYTLMKYFLYKT